MAGDELLPEGAMPDEDTDDFDEGFNLNIGDDETPSGGGDPTLPEEGESVSAEQPAPPPTDTSPQQEERQQSAPSAPPVLDEQPVQVPLPQPEVPQQAEAPKRIVPSDEQKGEIAELEKLSPQAAALAMEDSPEGEDVRKRLNELGALQAHDRAEYLLDRRAKASALAAEQQRATEAYNRQFYAIIGRDHPDVMEMVRNPAKLADVAKFHNDLKAWIESKPYKDAMPLMQTFQAGRADQVSALFTRFKTERDGAVKKQAKKPDPTGALAVPTRGAPISTSIGDEDDFDAGWNLNK
jgi:hypothetical protein